MPRSAIALLGMLLSGCAGGWAQTSQIQGTVKDSSGAAVPGAEVKATQTDTDAVRTATSDADGSYVLSNLPIGPYRIEVTKQSFSTYVQTGVVLLVDTSPTVDVVLKLGAVNEQVQVEANAGLVETQTINIGQVVENQRILDLPLNGRNAIDLVNLTAGVVQAGTSSSGNIPTGDLFSIAGSQTFGTTFYLDGTVYGGGVNNPMPFPDALQEFKVETGALSAQNGIHSGGAVTAVTKSGTNAFHGDAFEFLRNGDLNARNFFAVSRDTLKRNQYGGVVGGPIRRNKLFFFFGYQGTKLRSDPVATTAFVPTAQMLAGNWSAYASPACNGGKTLNLGAPFVNDQISPSLFNPASLKIVASLPPAINQCGKVLYGAVTQNNAQEFQSRVDYQISQKHSAFIRNMEFPFKQPAPYGISNDILATSVAGLNNLWQSWILGDTYLISTATVSSFRLSVNRSGTHRYNPDFFSGCDLGVQMYCFLPHQSIFSVTGDFAISGGTVSTNSPTDTTYEAGDDITTVKGAHQIAYGGLASYDMNNNRANIYSPGSFTFNGTGTTGNAMGDFLTGQLDSFSQGEPNVGFSRHWYVGAYVTDTWKVSPRFTVNAGVRWEPNLQTQIAEGAIYDFSMNLFLQDVKSTVWPNAPAGLTWPGDPGFPGKAGINRRFDQFAPRLGLAWDPTGSGKTSIRASYGLSYDTTGEAVANSETSPPFGDTIAVTGPVPFLTPWSTVPGGNPFPACGSNPCGPNAPFVPGATYIALQPNMKSTDVNRWTLAVQRQIGTSWLVSATYIGSQTSHLVVTHQLNPGEFLGLGSCTLPLSGTKVWNPCSQTANLQDRRLFSLISPANGKLVGFMDYFDAGGTSSYNGLLLTAQRRLSRGVAITANYTWSHCIGDLTQGSGVNGGGTGYQDLTDRAFDRGNCASQQIAGTFGADRRQIFNVTLVAESPRFANNILRTVASGWRLAPIFSGYSGGFVSLTAGTDRALDGNSNQRPNQLNGDPYCAVITPQCYLNPAAFGLPALGTLGNMGANNVLTPGSWNLDVTLLRLFRIHEGQSLEVRGEAFNVTNTYHPGVPSGVGTGGSGIQTALNASNFGQVISALDPRILQLAMKFIF
jgi:hypothetical protein